MPVIGAGIDTWSPCWYIDRYSWAGRMLDELATIKTARGYLLPEPIAGHRIGWNSGVGQLYAEGHPCAGGLAAPASLPGALSALVDGLRAADVPVPEGTAFSDIYGGAVDGFGGIRRLDSTVDLAMGNGAEGLAVMAGVAAVLRDAPRGKCEVFFRADGQGVETVYLRGLNGKRVLGRWYDKGTEAGSAAPGELIRPEDQRRYPKGLRRDVPELTGAYVRDQFQRRFLPLWRASKGVTVAGPMVLRDKLLEAVEAGEISPQEAERLAGHMLLSSSAGGRGQALRLSRRTTFRRRARARELGLVLADGVLQEVEVDLHDVLDQCMDSACWGSDG